MWGIAPSEFWAMTPREWWLIYDARAAKMKAELRAMDPAPTFTDEEREEMRRMSRDGGFKGNN